jgi:hypothetical protein
MAPPQGGAFDFERRASPGLDRLNCRLSLAKPDSNAILKSALILCVVTGVTARDGFAVDLSFVQTYSQAQGDV